MEQCKPITVSDLNNVIAAANDTSSGSDGASNKRASKKFKGVVEQPNGHWGAQIYAKHQRVWLGTFSSETEAAMAYDSAAIKLRGGECHRNFPWTKANFEEPHFQYQFSTEVVLSMIKDGSYQTKFLEFRRSRSDNLSPGTTHGINYPFGKLCGGGGGGERKENGDIKVVKRFLFQKELTPSDVGKLNRLVIPIKFAEKYFPRISEAIREKTESGSKQLIFFDKMMRSWTFRFCFWKSSKSFVFTRGWSRFVKTHHLKAKDTIAFFQCHRNQEGMSGGGGGGGNKEEPLSFCMITVNKDGDQNDDVGCLVDKYDDVVDATDADADTDEVANINMNLERDCKVVAVISSTPPSSINGREDEEEEGVQKTVAVKKGFIRIFGVEIADANAQAITS